MLHETVLKKVPYKNMALIDREKRSTKLNEVEPVENTNKNWQTFKGIRHVQTKVRSLDYLQHHKYE